jgi:ATP-dependent DNA ligase
MHKQNMVPISSHKEDKNYICSWKMDGTRVHRAMQNKPDADK